MNALSTLFITVVNMSITASYVALGVILIRLLFKRAPKIFSYALWLPVLFRLICPFSFSAAFGFLNLLKVSAEHSYNSLAHVPLNLGLMQNPSVNLGITSINKVVNNALPPATPAASVNPLQIVIAVLSVIWLAVFVLLVIQNIYAYLKVMRKVRTATLKIANVFETDQISTPFICGFLRPRIYLPICIVQDELAYILAHERVHLSRRDYLIKPVTFLAVLIHWFNPLMWLCFALMSKDMEMSCDESVLKSFGDHIKTNYSRSLLNLASGKHRLPGSSLAFGESHAKARIKNVLHYRKPALWVVVAGLVLTVALVVGFTANPRNEQSPSNLRTSYDIETLLANKTAYVGNNSKVVALINATPIPAGLVRDTIQLQTSTEPYSVTINYVGPINGQGSLVTGVFSRNSILLLSLIDNADAITCQILSPQGDTKWLSMTYTRAAANKALGGDVRGYASSAETLATLIARLSDAPSDSSTDSQTTIGNQIESNLATIMSSPSSSSNPQDYIAAHPHEYNAILSLDVQALPYLFTQFAQGEQTGLKGMLMEKLCLNILAGEDIRYFSQSPQDWYDTYKSYIQKLVQLNGLSFVQEHNPKGALILQ